jgi:HAD superfamily hydrolase (TIGR01509 family)
VSLFPPKTCDARGVIFDLDGVLIDSEALQFAAYSEALRDFSVSVTPATYAREWIATGMGSDYAVATFGLPITPAELKARKEFIYHRMLTEKVELMPGAAEAVRRMAAQGPVALATNSNAQEVDHVLERFGLKRHFAAVVTREQYDEPKPAPDAFLTAARALDLPPARCVVIEDAERGMRAAHAAGIPCMAVPHEWTREHDFSLAVRCLGSLDELTSELVADTLAAATPVGRSMVERSGRG